MENYIFTIEDLIKELNLIKSKEHKNDKELIPDVYLNHLKYQEDCKLKGEFIPSFIENDIVIVGTGIVAGFGNSTDDVSGVLSKAIPKNLLNVRELIYKVVFINRDIIVDHPYIKRTCSIVVGYCVLSELKELVRFKASL